MTLRSCSRSYERNIGSGPDGSIRVEHDRHLQGLFSRAQWLDLLSAAGFEASIAPIEHSDEPGEFQLFIAKKARRAETGPT